MIKYVVEIIQGNTVRYLSHNKKKWATCLEEAKHFNRLCDASSVKYRLDFSFSNVNANNPPAGLIAVNTVRVDITVNVI